jgi:hypothetical protein
MMLARNEEMRGESNNIIENAAIITTAAQSAIF